MRKGQLAGGKVATPIREMMENPDYSAVIFHCGTPEYAETTRIAALTLKLRNNYDIKTSRRGSDLVVYEGEYYDCLIPECWFEVNNYRDDDHWSRTYAGKEG